MPQLDWVDSPACALPLERARNHTQQAREGRREGTMKVKTISRVEESYTRDCKGDRLQVHRNRDPSLHPFEKVRLLWCGYAALLYMLLLL